MVWTLQGRTKLGGMNGSRRSDDRALQNLAPKYEELADAFSYAKDKVVIAKVDADGVGKPLGAKYGVTGFPSTFATCGSHTCDAEANIQR